MVNLEEIIENLPFSSPFLFVNELIYVNEKGASGNFTFHKEMDFFKGHFKGYPIVPGTILIESMAQIGGACLGIFYKLKENKQEPIITVATSYEAEFFKPVYPGEKVTVTSDLIYLRFGKLKYKVHMKNEKDEIVAKGVFSGMLK